MKPQDILPYIYFDHYAATPKYLQLANCILLAVNSGKLKKGDILPSINELSFEFDISRDTAEKGYRHLKKIEVLGSVPGKGYFIKNIPQNQAQKIFLLFNKLSPHKKIIYDAFAASLGENAAIDFYIYNNDLALFRKLLANAGDAYTHYVIIPHLAEGEDQVLPLINAIPKEKLVLLDKLVPGITGNYAAIYEQFEQDVYQALEQALEPLSKYHSIKIIFPGNAYYPQEILKGVSRFCQEYAFNFKVVHDISIEPVKEGEVFINLMDNDLVTLIEKILVTKMKVGTHIGVISYNETSLKRIILNGITTISTDFQLMGETAAKLILNKSTEHVRIPFSLRLRASL